MPIDPDDYIKRPLEEAITRRKAKEYAEAAQRVASSLQKARALKVTEVETERVVEPQDSSGVLAGLTELTELTSAVYTYAPPPADLIDRRLEPQVFRPAVPHSSVWTGAPLHPDVTGAELRSDMQNVYQKALLFSGKPAHRVADYLSHQKALEMAELLAVAMDTDLAASLRMAALEKYHELVGLHLLDIESQKQKLRRDVMEEIKQARGLYREESGKP